MKSFLGVDVGFSKRRRTTGLAAYVDDLGISVETATSDWDDRQSKIPRGIKFDVIALDGPLVPLNAPKSQVRKCEQVFSRGVFQKRCKPGFSHFGFGAQFRDQSMKSANEFGQISSKSTAFNSNSVFPNLPLVEAFPNAFLGVLLPAHIFESAPALKRGRKFDWLYENAARLRVFDRLVQAISIPSDVILAQLYLRAGVDTKRAHEEKAALVCLLTAALAAASKVSIVGDAASGSFWLPATEFWSDWAVEGLANSLSQLNS